MGPADKKRVELTDKIGSQIHLILNHIHNVNYSERFWKIILAPYVSAIISDINKIDGLSNYSEVPNEVYRNTLFLEKNYVRFMYFRQLVKYIQSIFYKQKTNTILKENQTIITGFHDLDGIPTINGSFIKALYSFRFFIKKDNKKRNLDTEILSKLSNEFSSNFYITIVNLMPKVFIEDFKRIYNSIQIHDAKSKSFHISFFESNYMRVLIAKYIEDGSKLYFYQHGGFCGEFDYLSSHRFESGISDKFMTWGWKMLPNDTPSYAYRLKTFVNKYRNVIKDGFKHDLIIVLPGIENANREYVKSDLLKMLAIVNRQKYSQICIRPRPIAKVNRKGELSYLNDSSLFIDSGYSKMVNLISESRLVIQLSYPNTNFYECLSVDHPVMTVLKNDMPSKIVAHHYDFLLSVGVFHKDVQSLAAFINKVNVSEWWSEVIHSQGYLSFKKEFLNLESN